MKARLAADRNLWPAGTAFCGTLAHVAGQTAYDSEPNLDELRNAVRRVMDETGEDKTPTNARMNANPVFTATGPFHRLAKAPQPKPECLTYGPEIGPRSAKDRTR